MRFRVFSVVAGLALAVGLSVAVGSASSARGFSPSVKGHAAALPASAPDALVTLLDNSSNDSGIGITSQNFEPSFDVYDNQGADDFVVPAGHKWVIKKLNVYGVYYNGSGPAASENITFYTSKNKLPGTVKKAYTAVTGTDSGGSFAITLPSSVALTGGTKGKHWYISAQVNMDFSAGGQWGWETSTNTLGYADAAWQNPGDGFGTGCTTWGLLNSCIPSGEGTSDMFTLKGVDKTP